MTKPLLFAALGALLLNPLPAMGQKVIELWPEGVPNIKADTSDESQQGSIYTHTHHPKLIYTPPKTGTANGTAVIFAAGGGYIRVNTGSGEFARWLTDHGVAVFTLIYRNQDYGHPAPLQDVLRAVRLVRSQAADYGLATNRIGAIGNSAGSHVIASAGTLFNAPEGKTGSPLDNISGRPDFMILTFPVITMEAPYAHATSKRSLLGTNASPEWIDHLSLEKQVTSETPPAFLVHTMEDQTVSVQNTLLFYQALVKAGVPVEMHLYEKGTHGSGLDPKFGPTAEWPKRAVEWMGSHGWLPAATQTNVLTAPAQ